jgi:hypothetical protein
MLNVHHTRKRKAYPKRKRIYFIKTKSPGQLIFGRNMLNVHHTKSGKYIQKVEELYFKTITRSPRELVFGRDMIRMSNILRIGSITART